MSGAGQQAFHPDEPNGAPLDIRMVRDMDDARFIPDAVHTPVGEHQARRSWAGATLKLAGLLGFLWLALSGAAVYLLVISRGAARLGLVDWISVERRVGKECVSTGRSRW